MKIFKLCGGIPLIVISSCMGVCANDMKYSFEYSIKNNTRYDISFTADYYSDTSPFSSGYGGVVVRAPAFQTTSPGVRTSNNANFSLQKFKIINGDALLNAPYHIKLSHKKHTYIEIFEENNTVTISKI